MKKKFLDLSIFVVVIFFMGCHNKQTDILRRWEEHVEILQEGSRIFDSKASTGDTAGGINDAISFLTNSNLVAWACYNDYNGIAVGFTDSTYGGIIIREQEPDSALSLNPLPNPTAVPSMEMFNLSEKMPTKQGAGFYAPYYSESNSMDYIVLSTIRREIPKVGFPNPYVRTNKQVTPKELASISGRGIVHISSHGVQGSFILPNKLNIQGVFLLLSVEVLEDINREYAEDIDKGWLVPLVITKSGNTFYGVSPDFIAEHNRQRWQNDNPLVWGGFCFSALGGWPKKMIEAGASAYLGWDGAVRYITEARYACSLYTFMCDTPCKDPISKTVGAYYATYLPKYWDTEDQRWVHLILAGDPFTTFQEPVPEGWQVGPYTLTFSEELGSVGFDSILELVFCQDLTNPYLFPTAGIYVGNAYSLVKGVTIIPIEINVVINKTLGYANWYYEWREAGIDVKPIFINFTEIDLPSGIGFGKVSGFVWGTLYWYPIPEPEYEVFFFGSFKNVSVAKAQFLTQGSYKEFTRNVHIYVVKKKPETTRNGTSSPSSDKRGRS